MNWRGASDALMLHVKRAPPVGELLRGTLIADGVPLCVSLENASKAIAPGRYPVRVTVSGRVKAGSLWSPRLDASLPLIDKVKGREGIRMHAANVPSELAGCIAPGLIETDDGIGQSRSALIALMARLDAAPACWLTVEDA